MGSRVKVRPGRGGLPEGTVSVYYGAIYLPKWVRDRFKGKDWVDIFIDKSRGVVEVAPVSEPGEDSFRVVRQSRGLTVNSRAAARFLGFGRHTAAWDSSRKVLVIFRG